MPTAKILTPSLRRLLGRLQRLALGVLAVGEQQDHLAARLAALAAAARASWSSADPQRAPDGGPAHRHVRTG